MKIVSASLSQCVHVWGIHQFLEIAEAEGHVATYLGPALSAEDILKRAIALGADCVAVSYRLTPSSGELAIRDFVDRARADSRCRGMQFIFAGTNPVADVARRFGFFHQVLDGTATEGDVRAILGEHHPAHVIPEVAVRNTSKMMHRLSLRQPRPLLRHHFGQATVDETAAGIARIADANVLDVICLGTDQDAQENFFRPERQSVSQLGAGGAPVRNEADLIALKAAADRGNRPLLRAYCGTQDIERMSEVLHRTIDNCSAGIPMFWYNLLDGRGPMGVEESIEAHQRAIRWHAEHNIPVEILDPHQWGMRGAHDTIFVVSGYIAAYVCRRLGVRHHIAQLMFNTPAQVSAINDLAKVLAVLELSAHLEDESFTILRMPRTGLLSFPVDEEAALGHLAAATLVQLAIRPHLINVVGYSEANRAAPAEVVIRSCRVVRAVIDDALMHPIPDLCVDPRVERRKGHLVAEALDLIAAIKELSAETQAHWTAPATLALAVRRGLLDSPQFLPGEQSRGELRTRVVNGGVDAVDGPMGRVLTEKERIGRLRAPAHETRMDHRSNRVDVPISRPKRNECGARVSRLVANPGFAPCPGGDCCHYTLLPDSTMLHALERLVELIGRRVHIVFMHKCVEFNRRIEGGNDFHSRGLAVDVDCIRTGIETTEIARLGEMAGFNAIGVYGRNVRAGYKHKMGMVHLGIEPAARRWGDWDTDDRCSCDLETGASGSVRGTGRGDIA